MKRKLFLVFSVLGMVAAFMFEAHYNNDIIPIYITVFKIIFFFLVVASIAINVPKD